MLGFGAMSRYLLFFGPVYYPCGGMEDFLGSYEDITEAIKIAESKAKEEYPDCPWKFNWSHIWDCDRKAIVWEDGKDK